MQTATTSKKALFRLVTGASTVDDVLVPLSRPDADGEVDSQVGGGSIDAGAVLPGDDEFEEGHIIAPRQIFNQHREPEGTLRIGRQMKGRGTDGKPRCRKPKLLE